MGATSAKRHPRSRIYRWFAAFVATTVALTGIALVLLFLVRWLLALCLLWFLGLLAVGAVVNQGWLLALEHGDSSSRLQVLLALETMDASSPISSLDPATKAAIVEALAACDQDADPEVVCRAAALRTDAERP